MYREKLLKPIKWLSVKFQDIRWIYKWFLFLHTCNEQSENEINTISFIMTQKEKIEVQQKRRLY